MSKQNHRAGRLAVGRRAFLKGLGSAIVGLPLLEYTHGTAWAGGAASTARRFITVFSHGGDIYNFTADEYPTPYVGPGGTKNAVDWWTPPQAPGLLSQLGQTTQPLAAHMDKLLVVRGIDNKAGYDQGTYGGGHSWCNVSILTAAKLGGNSEETATAQGPSIDHVIAERLYARYGGRATPLHLMVTGHQYGSPYFRGANQRQWGQENPRTAFASLFAGVTGDEGPDPALVRAWEMKKSVLDATVEGFPAFRDRLGSKDRQIVEAHLQHLRELEQRLTGEVVPTAQCVVPNQPANTTSAEQVGPLHADLIVAALRCGLTHVANLEIADILVPWAPSGLQVESGYGIGHSLHHMGGDVGTDGPFADQADEWLLEMKENRHWRYGLVKRILDGLDDPAFMEGDKTMLDNSLLYLTSEFSCGVGHNAKDTLCLLAGGAGGHFTTGRYINYNTRSAASRGYQTQAATNNLFVSFLNAFGESDTTFGAMEHAYKSGPLAELR